MRRDKVFSGDTLFIIGMAVVIESWSGHQDIATLHGLAKILIGGAAVIVAKIGIERIAVKKYEQR